MVRMDIISIPGSRILEIALVAFATPDVDFLCFGESDQPSPASAHAAAIAALDAGITRYPDVRGLPELRAALADYLTGLHARPVSEQRIQITASGMTAVSVALAATVRAGDRVVLHSPSWPNIGNAARLRGAQVDELDLTALPDGGFRLDRDRLDAMLQGARAFILNSPNNPTGWTATRDELLAILEITRRRRVWLIADEVYSRLVYNGAAAAPSMLDVAQPDDHVIVCNSFSKTWVMTGWRLGWMVVPEGARDAITELVEVTHSGVAPFIQHAGLAAIRDVEAVERFHAHCTTGRAQTSDALAGVNGVRYRAPDGAFYAFVGVEGLTDSLALAKKLVTDHRVAVAPGVAFGAAGEGFLRICFAQSADRIERAMGRLLDGLRSAAAA
ncbi:MAG TPA: pyridoxal phosphate-dependent aminotransferase [Acetobacteraceae bacterium]|jgi:aspartate aminotransferase|nr:pyridoxal phosphate-dependent aminotransferase [Acetobacteraceae bacterium]